MSQNTHKESLEAIALEIAQAGQVPVTRGETLGAKVLQLEKQATDNSPEALDSQLSGGALLPVARKLLADHNFRTPEDHRRIASDAFIVSRKDEVVKLLWGFLGDKTANKKTVVERMADKIGSARKVLFTASAPADLEKAREESRKSEEEAEGLASEIASAESSIRYFNVDPSLGKFNEAFHAIDRLKLS